MSSSPEGLAIIGIGCRFPGHGNSPAQFWSNLIDGVDCVSEAPSDRWNSEFFTSNRSLNAPGSIATNRCGFVDHIFDFDYESFGINKKEAENMDPQQKILLEVALNALEDSGMAYRGSNMGVYVGIGQAEQLGLNTADLEAINAYSVTGSALSIAANRLSYVFDLRGPSMSVDTACSSSMTAMHYAKQAIKRGECTSALVAGVNVLLDPGVMIQFSKLGVLSPGGKCKSFLDTADGYVRSEGCGVVIIKSMEQAKLDGDHIYASVLGTAVNSDGHLSPSLTMPSQSAQIEVFTQALVDAHIQPEQVFYAEAHATGTKVGDPVEANAIGKVLGASRNIVKDHHLKVNGHANGHDNSNQTAQQDGHHRELLIGAVKTHVGHLETASFMAGLIKCLLMLHHQTLVANRYDKEDPTIKQRSFNPAIQFEQYHMKVVTESQPFQADGTIMMISSFGFGGSNGAAIIRGVQPTNQPQQVPRRRRSSLLQSIKEGILSKIMPSANGHHDEHPHPTNQSQPPHLFVLSGPTSATLDARIAEAKQPLNITPQPSPFELSFTQSTRPLHRHVAFAVSESLEKANFTTIKKLRDGPAPPVVWCFAGQGPQHPEMGRTLYERYAVFRQSIDEMDAIYQTVAGESLINDIGLFGSKRGDPTSVYSLKFTLPSLVFLQTALVDLYRSFDVQPVAVFGHSFGEMAASYAAGVCDKKQLVTTAYHRAHLLASIDGNGVMMAVGCSPAQMQPWLDEHPNAAWIAAYNGPNSITVGGTADAITAISAQCLKANLFHRVLKITNAYHTPLMNPCKEEALRTFSSTLAGVGNAKLPYFSTVERKWKVDGFDAAYTWAGIEGAVYFTDAVNACIEKHGDETIFVEMSAHPVLAAYLGECGAKNTLVTLHRLQHEQEATFKAMMALRLNNASVDVKKVLINQPINHSVETPSPVALMPVIPFQRSYCHREDTEHRHRREVLDWRLLAGRAISQSINPTFEAKVSTTAQPWLVDHAVEGPPVFPAAGYIELAFESTKSHQLVDVLIGRGMIVPSDGTVYRTVRTTVEQPIAQSNLVTVHSKMDQWDNGPWSLHFTATAIQSGNQSSHAHEQLTIPSWCKGMAERCTNTQSSKQIYDKFRAVGLEYGPLFQGLQSLSTGDNEAVGLLNLQSINQHSLTNPFVAHPALIDSTFHVLLGTVRYLHRPYVPTRIKRIIWHGLVHQSTDMSTDQLANASTLRVYARSKLNDDRIDGDIAIVQSGHVIGLIEGMECTALGGSINQTSSQPTFLSRWQELALPHTFHPRRTDSWSHVPSVQDQSVNQSILDAACRAYVSRLIDQHHSGAAALKIDEWPEHRQRYWKWCLSLFDNQPVDASRSLPLDQDPAIHALQSLLQQSNDQSKHPFYIEAAAVERVGSNLHTLLTDQYAAQRLLFSDNLMGDLYSQSISFKPYVRLTSEYVVDFVESNPHRIIHVLEIGAGTGSLTADIFECLNKSIKQVNDRSDSPWKNRIKYWFTDVSQKFLNDARQRFKEYSFVEFGLFDLDQSFTSTNQSIPSHSLDLILCFDVLHVSSSLSESLARLQSLLVPNGVLMAIELTKPWMWTELFFGLFKGWHAYQDHRTKCWLTKDEWITCLQASSYHDISIMHDQSHNQSNDQQEFCHSLIVAHSKSIEIDSNGPVLAADMQSNNSIKQFVFDAADPGHDLDHLLRQSQELLSIKESTDFILVTNHSQTTPTYNQTIKPVHAPHIGFTRVLANEAQQHRVAMIDFDHVEDDADQTSNQSVHSTSRDRWLSYLKQLINHSQEREFAVRGNKLFVPRFIRFEPVHQQAVASASTTKDFTEQSTQLLPFRLEVDSVGQLSTLNYHISPLALIPTNQTKPHCLPVGPNEVLVKVHAAALNFKDLMLALGMLSNPMGVSAMALKFDPPTAMGLEFSGVVVGLGENVQTINPELSVGDEVYGIGKNCLASHVVTHAHYVCRKPAHLTHVEAASMPIVFCTSYAGLIEKAQLAKGDKVLIHSGAGGIGQSAIQLAKDRGATVITTVGSQSKREFLHSKYGVTDFADSHSTAAWKSSVMSLTRGAGVDVVLNSLKGDAIESGLDCLKVGGRFVEIGKVDILANNPLGMRSLLNDLSFLSVQLDVLMEAQPARLGRYFQSINQMANDRRIQPIVDRVFDAGSIIDAFRYLMSGQHCGKVMVDFNQSSSQLSTHQSVPYSVYPPSSPFSPTITYILSGGTGAVALELVRTMSIKGARYFLLLSRRGSVALRKSELDTLALYKEFGVHVSIGKVDVTDQQSIKQSVDKVVHAGFPRQVSIFHLAMVLDDDTINHLTPQRMESVMTCKVQGLDALVDSFDPSDVSSIVMFSSAASVLGNPAQANYAAANAYLDASAYSLHARGYIAKVVNLGVIEDVGILAEDLKLRALLTAKGFAGGLTSYGVSLIVEAMLRDSLPHDHTSWPCHIAPAQQYLHGAFNWEAVVADYPILYTRFAHLVDQRASDSEGDGAGGDSHSLEALTKTIAALLGMADSKLDLNESLARQGLDSLLAVELSATLKKKFNGLALSQMELLGGLSVQNIWDIFTSKNA